MLFCFADESGNENIFDPNSRFFIICGMLIKDDKLLEFEEDVANLAQGYDLKKKINLKGVQRWYYDYNRFGRLSLNKRKQFWKDLYKIFYKSQIHLVASVLDKWSFAKNYKPNVRDPVINRTYMHFLEKADQIVGESSEFEIIVFDETDKNKKEIIRHKHYWWVNHGTPYQEIRNTYWAPFFIREEESHLLQMAHICAYNLDFLFNKQKSDYFYFIKDAFCKYGTWKGKKVAIKVFPDTGTKYVIFRCENFEVSYWDYNEKDWRSEEEIERMKNFFR